jgi:hypothetical protein
MAPAVGDVLGTGRDQVFVPGFDCYENGNKVWAYGIHPDGDNHPGGPFMDGWPVALDAIGGCYSQSIDFVQGGLNSASIADFDGSGQLRIAMTPVSGFPVVLNADGSRYRNLAPACNSDVCAGIPPYYVRDSLVVGVTGQGAIGDLDGDGAPDYMQPVAGAVSLQTALGDAGQAALIHVYDAAWDVESGKMFDAFPTNQDGFPFFTSPTVAGLSDDGRQAMISSNDSYWIHARRADGTEAPGFPKWTGQWTSFGGVIGDPAHDGTQRLAYGTREGALFVWKVGGKPGTNNQWWHFRHDEHNSGRYGNDTRPPASLRLKVKRSKKSAAVSWLAPGNNGVSNGPAARYEVFTSKKPIKLSNLKQARRVKSPKPASPNRRQQIKVRAARGATLYVAVRAVDRAGNVSVLWRTKIKPFPR